MLVHIKPFVINKSAISPFLAVKARGLSEGKERLRFDKPRGSTAARQWLKLIAIECDVEARQVIPVSYMHDIIVKKRDIMLFIGKPKGRSVMISNVKNNVVVQVLHACAGVAAQLRHSFLDQILTFWSAPPPLGQMKLAGSSSCTVLSTAHESLFGFLTLPEFSRLRGKRDFQKCFINGALDRAQSTRVHCLVYSCMQGCKCFNLVFEHTLISTLTQASVSNQSLSSTLLRSGHCCCTSWTTQTESISVTFHRSSSGGGCIATIHIAIIKRWPVGRTRFVHGWT